MFILFPSESKVSRKKFIPMLNLFETQVAYGAAKTIIFVKLRKEEVARLLFCMALHHQAIREL